VFKYGGCYRYYLILKDRFPEAKAYWHKDPKTGDVHVVTRIAGRYYDIAGEIRDAAPTGISWPLLIHNTTVPFGIGHFYRANVRDAFQQGVRKEKLINPTKPGRKV